MTQDERWLARYNEVMAYLDTYHRNPSKHRIEDHLMLNWVKQQKKLMSSGKLKPERAEMFTALMAKAELYKRKNQW